MATVRVVFGVIAMAITLGIVTAAPATAASLPSDPPGTALVAPTPPMGFNGWTQFGCNVDETRILQVVDAFVSKGLKRAGYEYVNLDDCWEGGSRDAQGNLTYDTTRFPHGMAWLSDQIHARGLKFGIYSAASAYTCQGYPGSAGHYAQDMQTFANWKVDYIKMDLCGDEPNTLISNNCNNTVASQDFKGRYAQIATAIKATGRPMILGVSAPASIAWWCGYDNPSYRDSMTWAPSYGELWRTAVDAGQNWTSIINTYSANVSLAGAHKVGHWNDADLLNVGTNMPLVEQQTQFSLWSIMAAPLLISADLNSISSGALAILNNQDIVDVNQDRLGDQGVIMATGTNYDVLAKQLANGDRAVVLFNKGSAAQTISTTLATIGFSQAGTYYVTDLVSKARTTTTGALSANVPSHGTVMYRISRYPTLAHAFNNVAITNDSAPTAGNMDGAGNSYSAQALATAGLTAGGSFDYSGLSLPWPSSVGTANNVVGGATISVAGSGSVLGFLGAGVGASATGTGTVTYTDGTTQAFTLSFPNWADATTGTAVVSARYRNTQSGPANYGYYYGVFFNRVNLQPGKTVASVTLPSNASIHVFSVAISRKQSLAQAANNVGITSDSAPTAGNIDGSGNSYSSQALATAGLTAGGSFLWDGLTFTWPTAVGTPNNVAGRATIAVTGTGTVLGFLGSGVGASATGTGTVTYTDGSTQNFSLSFPNWAETTAGTAVVSARYRNTQSGPANSGYYYRVFYNRVDLTPGKKVESVTLPDNPNVHVFAISLN